MSLVKDGGKLTRRSWTRTQRRMAGGLVVYISYMYASLCRYAYVNGGTRRSQRHSVPWSWCYRREGSNWERVQKWQSSPEVNHPPP